MHNMVTKLNQSNVDNYGNFNNLGNFRKKCVIWVYQ